MLHTRGIFLNSILLVAIFQRSNVRAYTTEYALESYYSEHPYNLDLYYFLPADVPLDPIY